MQSESKNCQNCKKDFTIDLCQSSSNIFGCIGLQSKQYCLLNKQYQKEEYLNIIEKIKKHMNEYSYPPNSSRREI